MKILHVCRYFQPQLGYQEYFLAKEHIKAGHEVLVLTSDRYFPFPDYEHTVKPILGERICGTGHSYYEDIPICRLKTSFEWKTASMWLHGLEAEVGKFTPDYVIAHGIGGITEIRLCIYRKHMNYKLVFDDHTLLSEIQTGLIGWLYYRIYPYRFLCKNSEAIIGVAAQCIDFMTKKCRFPMEKCTLIPLGANAERFVFSYNERERIRREYHILPNDVLIIYTGKLTKAKGPHLIAEALRKIENRIKDYTIFVMYVGNCSEEYQKIYDTATSFFSSRIKSIKLPAVNNEVLPSYYSAADIAVWPRQGSMSMLEAMACKCPIICCDYLAERCKYGNGLTIQEDNLEALAEAINKLIVNPDLRKQMGIAGREYIDKELSWAAVAQQFLNLIDCEKHKNVNLISWQDK